MEGLAGEEFGAILVTRLGKLLDAAVAELGADAIIVTRCDRDEGTFVAAWAGVSSDRAKQLAVPLACFEPEIGDRPVVALRSLATAPDKAATELVAAGYGGLVSARVEIGLQRVGALHILRRDADIPDNEPLVRAYANHVAVTIFGSQRSDSAAPTPARVVDELEDLALTAHSFAQLTARLDEALTPLFGPVRTGIMLWNDERDVLQMVSGSFGADARTAASYQVIASKSHSNAARVFASGEPYVSNCAVGDPAILQDYVEAFGITRLLSMRLDVRSRKVGVLHIANKPSDYTVADLWRLQPLIPKIARAVETAKAFFLLRRRQRLERILSEVAVGIASGQSVQDFLTLALDALSDALEASLVALAPVKASPIVSRTHPVDTALEQKLLAQAARQPALRADIVGPLKAGDPGSSALHVPVLLGLQRLGTLSTLRLRAEPFAEDERSALERLAKLAALAWAAERYQQHRAELARIEERRRIADDLHDDVAQILFVAQMVLDATLEIPALGDAAIENVVRARALLIKVDEGLRAVIHQLARPPANNVAPELERVLGEIEDEFQLCVGLEIDEHAADASMRLSQDARQVMLRVVRESLVNSAKHAGPCQATVRLDLDSEDRLTLSVADDGVGIASANGGDGHGIKSLQRAIRNCGGTLSMRSTSAGTTVVVRLQLP